MNVEKRLNLHTQVVHQELHIRPNVLLGRGIPKQIGGVIRADNLCAAVIEKAAAELSDRLHAGEQILGRDATQADDIVGIDDFDLAFQVFPAIGRLIRAPACDYRAAGSGGCCRYRLRFGSGCTFENAVQKLACRSDERLSPAIFVGTGRFAEEHDPRLWIADAKDGFCPGLAQFGAPAAPGNTVRKNSQPFLALGSRHRRSRTLKERRGTRG